MPVDSTGLIIAIVFWLVGTWWAFIRIWTKMESRHNKELNGPLPLVRPIFWTMWASILLAVVAFFIVFLYDLITVGRRVPPPFPQG